MVSLEGKQLKLATQSVADDVTRLLRLLNLELRALADVEKAGSRGSELLGLLNGRG